MRRRAFIVLLAAALSIPAASTCVLAQESDSVVLLHGLLRTDRSMNRMDDALKAAGFRTCNVAYPSRSATVERLAADNVLPAVESCAPTGTVHFVTHSMGGIILRELAAAGELPRLGRVVMLGPPNQGSEVVDNVGDWWLFEKINGPAGAQLGTGEGSLAARLGPAHFQLGIIAGTRSINWINSLMIDGADDGKVSVTRARLAGMSDFMALPTTHTFMMKNRIVIRQTVHFLQQGRFDRANSH